jgi:hypothetical protein
MRSYLTRPWGYESYWVVENDRMEIAAGRSSSDVRPRKTIPIR